ncbi:hypothetical protein MtrunA17_Chr4g0067991 [Medicago truncatula]|uniref:COBRA C-terminal domain-containing protein n=1 Tax=Medicago truncatula TaxID=3880 RepID=A0A396IFM5_MEDTR|nr:hypothetical protein MtrunA17_Chr4g0067991 [Medicago truncatula]
MFHCCRRSSLLMMGFICPKATGQGKNGTNVCCPRDPKSKSNITTDEKKTTPGISVVCGEAFPTKVFFKEEECSLPSVFPTSGASRKRFSFATLMLLPLLPCLLVVVVAMFSLFSWFWLVAVLDRI